MRVKITGIGTSDGHFLKAYNYIGMIGEIVPERIHPDGSLRGKFEEEGTGKCLFFNKVMYERARGSLGDCKKYKPKKPAPQYRLLKAITGWALVADSPANCDEFKKEIIIFIARYGIHTCATMSYDSLDEYVAQVKPKNHAWLIKKGYLERIEPARTYRVGQKLKAGGGSYEYAVAPVGEKEVQLIATDFLAHYGKPIRVESFDEITQAEMDQMVGRGVFQGVVS